MKMESHSCLVCGKRIGEGTRENVIKRLANLTEDTKLYSWVYRILKGVPLCHFCYDQVPIISDSICKICGREMVQKEHVCTDCQIVPNEFRIINRSSIHYNDWAKRMISRWKYRGDEQVGSIFATLLTLGYYRYYKNVGIQLITYVPLHQERLIERGFNQAEVLARVLGERIKLPVLPLVIRTRNTLKQSKQTDKKARKTSLEGAFEKHLDANELISATKILLIDDIYTTGATLRSCASIMKEIPVYQHSNIYGLTLSRS